MEFSLRKIFSHTNCSVYGKYLKVCSGHFKQSDYAFAGCLTDILQFYRDMGSHKLNLLANAIKAYPDFPKKGVIFRDLFSVLKNAETFNLLMELLVEHVRTIKKPIDAVVGLDARGFILAPHIALNLNVPFVPVRKKGKLPGEVAQVNYDLEYGQDTFEIQKASLKAGQSVLLVDDLLATGGSLAASCQLMDKIGVNVTECFVVIELMDLKGREKLKSPVHSLVQY